LREKISVETGIWKPETYRPWALKVLPKSDPASPNQSAKECAFSLLSPDLKTLLAENDRISAFLNLHPGSAAGHLQAALLVGTIALNDYSGRFQDIRIPLNRMVAHLAAADALGLPSDDRGRQLAEAMRLTLSGLQADALASVKSWPSDHGFGDWEAILKLRNTTDWRDGRTAALTGSPALQSEYYRALCKALSVSDGLRFLGDIKGTKEKKSSPADAQASWYRIPNEFGRSVSESHAVTTPILGVELGQIAPAATRFGVTPSKENFNWLKDYLDTPEGSPVTIGPKGPEIAVAGRNLFAGYHQRHFMQGARNLFAFFNDSWGVYEQAEALATFLSTKVPDLRYKPFLMRMNARTEGTRKSANTVCETLIASKPELVTPTLWASLRKDQRGKDILPSPDFHGWFSPEIPQGTAFDAGERLYEIGVGDENNRPWLRTLWERAPYSNNLALFNAGLENGSQDNIPPQLVEKWLALQIGVDVFATKRIAIANEGNPDIYEKQMGRAADMDPDLFFRMGDYFIARSMDDKAATAYIEGYKRATDRVFAANKAGWLVKYLVKKGDRSQARKVAEDAAEVYSYAGLEALRWLEEYEGNWDKALVTAAKIDERYGKGKSSQQVACLIRLNELSADKAEAAGYSRKIFDLFPKGVQKAGFLDFSGPPSEGVIIQENSQALTSFGLSKDMVIVALNGYRTETFAQYDAIRSLSDAPEMQLIVWDGSRYRVTDGKLPGRKFGVEMVDYKK